MAENLGRYRTGARPNFENAARPRAFAKLTDECLGQETAARQQGAGIAKMPPRFADEIAAFHPEAHPGASKRVAPTSAGSQVGACSIANFHAQATGNDVRQAAGSKEMKKS